MITEASIHYQLLYFYLQNDPNTLKRGLDISKLVAFTLQQGFDKINQMLVKRYGKAIDFFDKVLPESASAIQYHQLSPNSFDKRQCYFTIIKSFLLKYDAVSAEDNNKVERLVKFALEHGMESLSNKFELQYGTGVINTRPKYEIDIARFQSDLVLFYTEFEDEEQIEVIIDTITHVFDNGLQSFNENLKDLYGTSLNEFNERNGRRPHIHKRLNIHIPRVFLKRDLEVYYAELGHWALSDQIEAMLNYQEDEGMEALNSLLHENFGISLDDYNEMVGKKRFLMKTTL